MAKQTARLRILNNTFKKNRRQARRPQKRLKRRSFTLPKNFKVPPLPPDLEKHVDEGLWIIHLLFGTKFYDSRRTKKDRWHQLGHKRLRAVIDKRRIAQWLRFWVDSGYIEPSGGGYIPGLKSCEYRMVLVFRLQPAEIYWVKDRKVKMKLTKYYESREFWHDDPLYRKMRKNLHKISIDKEAAIDFINTEKDYSDSKIKDPEYARSVDESSIEMLASSQRNFMVDDYGRNHSNLTNLSKDLRQFLFLKNDNDGISITDINNSQAYIAALLMKSMSKIESEDSKEFKELFFRMFIYAKQGKEKDKARREEKKRKKEGTREGGMLVCGKKDMEGMGIPRDGLSCEIPHTLMKPILRKKRPSKSKLSRLIEKACGNDVDASLILNSLFSFSVNNCELKTYGDVKIAVFSLLALREAMAIVRRWGPSLKSYVDDCCSGVVYDRVVEWLPESARGEYEDRRHLKQQFFRQVIYSKCAGCPDRPLRDVFMENRSDAWRFFLAMKKAHHSVLPKLMQYIESEFVIKVAARGFSKKHPQAFLATVHDSLMVPARFRDDAVECLRDAFRSEGLSPRVSVETISMY